MRSAGPDRRRILVAGLVAALCAVAALWIAWDGPVGWLDAPSYAAAIEAISDGRGVTSHLAASFSAFNGAEFVQRGGSIPFVDFPVGYPLAGAAIAVIVGTEPAMLAVTIGSVAILGALVVAGPRRSPSTGMILGARAIAALALVGLPISRSLIAAGLSEPLFLALAVGAAKLTVDALQPAEGDGAGHDRLPVAVLLAGLAGLVRFVGAVLIVVPAAVMWRRDGARRALSWAALALAPVIVNVLWASAQGSGHRLGWRGMDTADLRFATHSVGGWVSSASGMFDLFNAPPPVWQVLVALAWGVTTVIALISVLFGRPRMHPALAVCGAMSLLIALALGAAMSTFDSLVTLDNRLMLPSGVLAIVGLLWWATGSAQPSWRSPMVLGLVGLWAIVAVGPWDVTALRSPPPTPGLAAAVEGVDVVLSNDADQVWWNTGTPAAYMPRQFDLLTGEPIDVPAEMRALPCLLAEHNGAILWVITPFGDQMAATLLPAMVASGELSSQQIDDVTVFRPTGLGCGVAHGGSPNVAGT